MSMRQILSRLTAVKFFLTAVAHFFLVKINEQDFWDSESQH